MACKALPSQEVLRQLLDYDPSTGALTWRERGADWFASIPSRDAEHICAIWNSKYAGSPALANGSSGGARGGYLTGSLFGAPAKAHRVIWKWMTGEDPDQVDHINGVRSDNRWDNLRNVSHAENAKNYKRRKDNTTGIVGVYWRTHHRAHGKWLAKVRGRHIGIYSCLGQAIRARRAAEREYGFHENHGRAA